MLPNCRKESNLPFDSACSGSLLCTARDGWIFVYNRLFTVHSVDCKKAHCVKCFPKPPVCSCPSTGRCFHVIAVQMALRDNLGEDRASYSLSLLRKRHRGGEQKSGRKKPRSKDYDYTVVPAPDALEPMDRSILPTHSTPKKACTPFRLWVIPKF